MKTLAALRFPRLELPSQLPCRVRSFSRRQPLLEHWSPLRTSLGVAISFPTLHRSALSSMLFFSFTVSTFCCSVSLMALPASAHLGRTGQKSESLHARRSMSIGSRATLASDLEIILGATSPRTTTSRVVRVLSLFAMRPVTPNHALQRTRHGAVVCTRGVSWAGSLSLGRWAAT